MSIAIFLEEQINPCADSYIVVKVHKAGKYKFPLYQHGKSTGCFVAKRGTFRGVNPI